ncbi:hypothetical protein Tsubulata_026079 [Turnera subulata]|uniref:Plastocyanin-like domain-containing protein n=1 Tax=Turnera subulata TaxID=218843 RepID=A0A9Q0G5U0_9ROSI|nr:hypothetical protein Tsubulata_026079 [Turnera subulata]
MFGSESGKDSWMDGFAFYFMYDKARRGHGIRQLQTGWKDGPVCITQCTIQPGQSYAYNFTITGQRGTLRWHAHILWLKGPLSMAPSLNCPSVAFPIHSLLHTGYTINHFLFTWISCGFTLPVESGKTYMLSLINVALNEELFFKIVGHKRTVVESDNWRHC